mmetsp:Transcript_16363/g.23991  ORF Transcript_16363/g.23991 Transcript_16363/m.23991 type:complete len:192 (+) Transcript_16363:170-745(+)
MQTLTAQSSSSGCESVQKQQQDNCQNLRQNQATTDNAPIEKKHNVHVHASKLHCLKNISRAQRIIVLLRHASRCSWKHEGGCSHGMVCPISKHCFELKKLRKHIMSCREGRACNYPHCVSSRFVLSHYMSCRDKFCPVCAPVKSANFFKQKLPKTTPDSTYKVHFEDKRCECQTRKRCTLSLPPPFEYRTL